MLGMGFVLLISTSGRTWRLELEAERRDRAVVWAEPGQLVV
jgi:hypothetical protein